MRMGHGKVVTPNPLANRLTSFKGFLLPQAVKFQREAREAQGPCFTPKVQQGPEKVLPNLKPTLSHKCARGSGYHHHDLSFELSR